jgi:hypothetical protein
MNGVIPTGWAGNWEYVAMAWGITVVVLVAYAVSLVLRTREVSS